MFGTPQSLYGWLTIKPNFFRTDRLQLSLTTEIPLQKSVIHVQTWRFATFCRSRRLRCLNLPEVYSTRRKKRRYHAHIFIILNFLNIKR